MKKVLVVSVGLSPQVVSETIYALAMQENWFPDELVLLTTKKGEKLCNELLLDTKDGALHKMASDWNWPQIHKLANNAIIKIITSDSGDINCKRSIGALANISIDLLRNICSNPNTELHLSLAGGRKPVAAILTLAISVFGRPQDRLSHVLVSDDISFRQMFFYPTPFSKKLSTTDGRMIDISQSQVNLMDIPFPRLAPLVKSQSSEFSKIMEEVSKSVFVARLYIDCVNRNIVLDGKPLDLPPSLAAWLSWLAFVKKNTNAGLSREGSAKKDFVRFYRMYAKGAQADKTIERLSDPLDPEWMEEKASRIAKLVGGCHKQPYGINMILREGPRSYARYMIGFDAREINIIIP